MYRYYKGLLCFLIGFSLSCGQQSKVYQLTYTDFDESHYDKCVRLLNGTHQIGCQSSNAGNVGVLYVINDTQTRNDFFNKAYLKAYVTLVDANYFNRDMVQRLKASGKVQGIIAYEPDNFVMPTNPWSPELSCPGNRFSVYNSTSGADYLNCNGGSKNWNPPGDGLTEDDIPFPVFYLKNSRDRDTLLQCTEKYNSEDKFPLCAVQMKSRMFGAVNTETCTRRSNWQTSLTPEGYCDPIGGRNIVSSLKQLSSKGGIPNDTILVTAPVDSRSFMSSFTSPGSDLATGFITLLATSKALGKLSQEQRNSLSKNILFAVMEGEAFDNIGTTRMLYDMKNNNFPLEMDSKKTLPHPINIASLSHVLEFRQLGKLLDKVYAHHDPVTYRTLSSEIDSMVQLLNSTPSSITVGTQPSSVGLSPSSFQTILKQRAIPGIVLTDYQDTFKNRYYFSRYDTLKNLGINYNDNTTDDQMMQLLQPLAAEADPLHVWCRCPTGWKHSISQSCCSKKLTQVANMAAGMLYKMASGSSAVNPSVVVDTNTTAQLIFCYLYKANCTLFQEALPTSQISSVKLPNSALPRYASVYQGANTLTLPSGLASYLLVYFTGENVPGLNKTTCKTNTSDQTVRYFYLNGPKFNATSRSHSCWRSSTYDTAAVSPAIQQNKFDKDSASQSGLWTESRWSKSAFKLTMFLQQDQTSQGLVLLAGFIMLISGFTSVYFINTKSIVLFRATPPL